MQINIEYLQRYTLNEHTKKILLAFGLKETKKNLIVKDFDFPFEYGKNYYICGYSGSGKSSLLNTIYEKIKNENTIYIKTWQNLNIKNMPIIQFFQNIRLMIRFAYYQNVVLVRHGSLSQIIIICQTVKSLDLFYIILYYL